MGESDGSGSQLPSLRGEFLMMKSSPLSWTVRSRVKAEDDGYLMLLWAGRQRLAARAFRLTLRQSSMTASVLYLVTAPPTVVVRRGART